MYFSFRRNSNEELRVLQFHGEAKITVGHTGIEWNCKKIPSNVCTRKYAGKKRCRENSNSSGRFCKPL